ncbi:Concanavalin A-like lectin/glucanase [Cordyceps fumosorosea ARSEF 2679]|uniref:Concanavalin A-like lectin/glucanase n=1 Tax=Cordyceps fumosorosea (strain ARSEF 2679) TaxID=1081104 RepID=A0A167DL44_CORFA|nr:Concanavalin A-like lectin/glucanase [Cordyceps fumosorosea ARSEF 2679]OAA42539.1 Concanavalin A-like lectin/glucanase [Cordyceps fumosorosea ARSEF 2679]
MSGPGHHRSPGADPGLTPSTLASSQTQDAAVAAAADHTSQRYNFYTHPSRISILDGTGNLTVDPAAFLPCSPGQLTSVMDDSAATNSSVNWLPSAHSQPSFSRAFDLFYNCNSSEPSEDGDNSFFVPSYLRSSSYMHILQEAHRSRRHSRREQRRNGTLSSSNGFSSDFLPAGSHHGLSHTVVERGAPSENRDGLAPLPTRWNTKDMSGSIDVHSEGLGVRCMEDKDREHESLGIRADHHMPLQCGIYYFEVQILSARRDDIHIGIGFSTTSASTARPVGWEPESWGYHADDGRCFAGNNVGRPFGPKFGAGDVVGCGVNFRDRTAFFTRNGLKIGTAFHDVTATKTKLFPAVSLRKAGEHVLVNFGQTPFVYNIDDMMRSADTSKIEPGLCETDLIQALVMQFLQHDGYIETARAFAEDLKVQNEALSSDTGSPFRSINIRDDEDANNRQRIRRAILEGDVDRALKLTNAYYPLVLQEHEGVYFKLRCRKFIEMVRKAAQLNMAADAGENGGAQDMDIDANGDGDGYEWPDAPVAQNEREVQDLEQDMLEYGQALQGEYAEDSRKEVGKVLDEIWSLIAYRNPLREPQVSHLLARKGRVVVAEELNSAILSSLGKSSRAALEKLYAQTSVLLDDLRQDGGDGAFISVGDVTSMIHAENDV